MLKLLNLVHSLFSNAEISGCVPPSLLFQHGHGYDRTGRQQRSRDAKQLPRLASTGVSHSGADVVFCKAPLLAGMLYVRGRVFLSLKVTLLLVIFFYT